MRSPRAAVGPAKAILRRVFPAAAAALAHDVVLLHEFMAFGIDSPNVMQPAAGNRPGQAALTVARDTRHPDPRRRRPAVGRVPLLAGCERGRDETAGLEQRPLHRRAHAGRLAPRGAADEERIESRGREPHQTRVLRPEVIEVDARAGIPQVAIDGRAPLRGAVAELGGAGAGAALLAAPCDR